MSTMRAFALMEAERLALNESMNAMIQLAEVRERMYSESHEQNTDLHSQVMAAEKLHEEAVDSRDALDARFRDQLDELSAVRVRLTEAVVLVREAHHYQNRMPGDFVARLGAFLTAEETPF